MGGKRFILPLLLVLVTGCSDSPTESNESGPVRRVVVRAEPGTPPSAEQALRWVYATEDSTPFRAGGTITIPKAPLGTLVFATNAAADPIFVVLVGEEGDVSFGPRSTVVALIQMVLRLPYPDLSPGTTEPHIVGHPDFAEAVSEIRDAAGRGISYLANPSAMTRINAIARDVGRGFRPPISSSVRAQKLYPIGVLPVGVLEGEGTDYTVRNISPLYWSVTSEDLASETVIATKITPPSSASLFQIPPIPLNPTDTPLRGVDGAVQITAEEDFSQNALRVGADLARWGLDMAGKRVHPADAEILETMQSAFRPEHFAIIGQAESAEELFGAVLDALVDVAADVASNLPRVGSSYFSFALRSLVAVNVPLELIDKTWFAASWYVYYNAKMSTPVCQEGGYLVDCGNLVASLENVTMAGSRSVRNGFGHLRCNLDISGTARGGDSGKWKNVVGLFSPISGTLENMHARDYFDRAYFRSGETLKGRAYVYQNFKDSDGRPAWPTFRVLLDFSYALASDQDKTRSVSMLVTCLGGGTAANSVAPVITMDAGAYGVVGAARRN